MSVKPVSLIAALFFLFVPAPAQDWPQWRGPGRDGLVDGFKPPASWPESLARKWRITVGEGHSSPLYVGGRVYVFSRQRDEEVVSSVDLGSGKVVWRQSYPAPYSMNPAAVRHGMGPKSTPVIAGGRLYTFGISGILSCFEAATGKPNWRKEFSKQFRTTSPLYGTAMSPLVERGRVIAHVGGHDGGALTAFDAVTGEIRWQWTGDGPAYASPVIVSIGGVHHVVTQTQSRIVGVSAETGKLLWQIPFTTPYVQNCVTPVAHRDLLILGGLSNPTMAVRPVRKGDTWSAEEVWKNADVPMYMSSVVKTGDLLFGFSNRNRGQFFVVDGNSGNTLWTGDARSGDNAAIVMAAGLLFSLTNDAELTVGKADANGLEVLRKYKVADSPTWAHPVVLSGGVLVKDATTLALWSFQPST